MTVVAGSSQPSVADDFQIGDRVLVSGMKPGIIVFIGEVHFSPGDWAGVVLDTPTGKNDGKVGGHRYFMCEPMRGVFCRLNKLTKLPGGAASTVAPTDPGSTTLLEKSNSPPNSYTNSGSKSVTVESPLPKAASFSKPAAVSVEKPPSPCLSTGSHHSDHGIPVAQAATTNHSDADDHIASRFCFLSLLIFSSNRVICR